MILFVYQSCLECIKLHYSVSKRYYFKRIIFQSSVLKELHIKCLSELCISYVVAVANKLIIEYKYLFFTKFHLIISDKNTFIASEGISYKCSRTITKRVDQSFNELFILSSSSLSLPSSMQQEI